MSGEDPYASPQSISAGAPDAPESFGWELVGNRVWVEKFAQFPMVDPYSGGSDEVMTMNRLTVGLRPMWQLIAFIILFCTFIATLLLPIDQRLKAPIAVGTLLILWVGVLVGMFNPSSTLNVFYGKRTVRIQTAQNLILRSLFILGNLFSWSFGNARSLSAYLEVSWLPGTLLILWISGLIWINLIQRRLTCRRHMDGRFEIRGFHSKALDLMAQRNGIPPISLGMDSLSSRP